MEPTEIVMQTPHLVEKIAKALRYTALKECRSLNTLWYQEVTKVLKQKSVMLVSRDTIPDIMNRDPNSKDIFCTAVKINTSFSLGDTAWLLNFFGCYAKHLEYIEWADSKAICQDDYSREDGERRYLVSLSWNFELRNLTELILESTFAFGNNLELIIKSAPNLRILRVNTDDRYCIKEFLAALQSQTDLKNLKTLQFGEDTYLKEEDVRMLIGLHNLELKEFIMEGRMLQIRNGWVYKAILERWSKTLETAVFRTVMPFKLDKIMDRLKYLKVATFRIKRTLPINILFPVLEHFEVHFAHNFRLDAFVPEIMEPHMNICNLSFIDSEIENDRLLLLVRLLSKCPNLTILSIPTNDAFLRVIYDVCPNLKSLYLSGTFTDTGITGIENRNLDIFYGILMATGKIVGEDSIEKKGVRRWKSILNLKKLEVLSLGSSLVGDKSVLWGILGCKLLKEFFLPENVTCKSMEALEGMRELRQLSIPAPYKGNISFDTMKKFTTKMIHVQLRCAQYAL